MSTLKIKKMEKLHDQLANPPRPTIVLNVILDAELHKIFKIKAAQDQVTLSELIRKWVTCYVG